MKKEIQFIVISLLLWGCSNKKEPEPCYVGTWESENIKNCISSPQKLTLILMSDGTGAFLEPNCGTNSSFKMAFTYTYNQGDSELRITVTRIEADNISITSSFNNYVNKFPFLTISNSGSIPLRCKEDQTLSSSYAYFYTKTLSEQWKKVQ